MTGGVHTDGKTRVLRVAMADPTDTAAILELEVIANCEIEVTALPLSAIEELVDRGYKQFSTAVMRPQLFGRTLNVNTKQNRIAQPIDDAEAAGEREVTVTAQIPLASLVPASDIEARFAALCQLLVTKGLVTEAELAEAIKKADSAKPSES